MSQTTQKIPIEKALELAFELAYLIKPLCQKFEIAGSVRRGEEQCGDIEIVCIPHLKGYTHGKDLFGIPKTSYLNRVINWIDTNEDSTRIKGGPKYQKIEYKGVPVDIFMTSREEFGRMLAIRTGPAEYSKKMAARWVQLGYHGKDGKLIHEQTGERAGPFPTEESFFEFLGWNYIKPEARK